MPPRGPENEEDRRQRLRLVEVPRVEDSRKRKAEETFTGKHTITKDGRISINRRNRPELKKDWFKRRRVEPPPPGGWPAPPAHWPKEGLRVDLGSVVPWLPSGWGQGVKLTCVSHLKAFVSPKGKVYYHKHVVLPLVGNGKVAGNPASGTGVKAWKRKFDGFRAKWDKQLVEENLKEVRSWVQKQIKARKNFQGQACDFAEADRKLFQNLTARERARLPKSASGIHFSVISARRAGDARSIRALCNVQAQLTAAGARPVWYVDKASLRDYRRLGLKAKVGGKLVPSRNLALQDAKRLGRACVQVSDDISDWSYYVGKLDAAAFRRECDNNLKCGNMAANAAQRLRVSPAAAARFLLAKLRAADGPKLAGVFPLGNTGMAFAREAVSTDCFVLGDFFVADRSSCRFDPRMTLKEDYDFTCQHLSTHGSVLRSNRMFITAVHETNPGGAVSERDAAGERERENIRILQKKWPGVFSINGKRGDTQVVMCWRRLKRSKSA